MTTTAQSSVRLPPEYARHASITASAIACGADGADAASTASSRSIPKSSRPVRASIDTVGVDHDGATDGKLGAHLLVRLRGVDAEREPAACRPSTRPSGWTRRGSGCPALAHEHLAAGIDGQVRHRDELADRDLSDDDVVRVCEERRRLGVLACERAEDELRHRHVCRRIDAVARDVAEDDREPAVGELEEVEDVAADVDLRSRLVDGTDLEARDGGPLARQAATAASSPRTASAAGRGARCRSRAQPAARSCAPWQACRHRSARPGRARGS